MIGCLVLFPFVFGSMIMSLVIGMVTIFFSSLTFAVSAVTGALVMSFAPVIAFMIILFS